MDARLVLVVDDEPDLCDLLKRYLERQGYAVETALTGEEAWDKVQRDPARFSAYLVDLTLPAMTGEVLAQRILGVHPSARILLSSGYAYDPARLNGNVAFLRKPFLPKELAEALAKLVAKE
jgi:CheY-like chemotaxis protein